VSYATIHAMRSRAQLRRGPTLAQKSHERVRVCVELHPLCSRNAHTVQALPAVNVSSLMIRLSGLIQHRSLEATPIK